MTRADRRTARRLAAIWVAAFAFLLLNLRTVALAQLAVSSQKPRAKSLASQLQHNNLLVKSDVPRGHVKGQLIVKYKDSVTEGVDGLLAGQKTFRSATVDRSDSLDRLHTKYRVKRAQPVFRAEFKEQPGVHATAMVLQQQQTDRARRALNKFSTRTKRAPRDAVTPDLTQVYVLALPDDVDIDAAVQEFAADPHVEYAQANDLMEVQQAPDDPYYSRHGSWGQAYDDLWGLKLIHAEQAWAVTKGEGVVVAVIDTGVDYTHPDLAANMWSNSGEIPGNGVDDDGNGYVDDIHGWDFVTFDDGVQDSDPMDDHYHGTHVAGTIAAVGNNGVGVIGVAPAARIMAVKGLNGSGSGASADLAAGIRYAADNGADVLNNSWGGGGSASPVLRDALQYAASLGCVIVVSAGNSALDATLQSPANDPHVITVAASDPSDQAAWFSNFGPKIDVAAPGFDVLSTRATMISPFRCTNQPAPNGVPDPNYCRLSGTSMASPHVSGVAALVLGAHPDWSAEQVRQALRRGAAFSSTDLNSLFTHEFGYGRVDAAGAVQVAQVPALRLLAPKPMQQVASGTITISGEAGPAANPPAWSLDLYRGLLPEGVQFLRTLATGTSAAVSATLDTTGMGPGYYTVILQAGTGTSAVRDATVIDVTSDWVSGWPRLTSSLAPYNMEFGTIFPFRYPEGGVAVGDVDGDGQDDVVLTAPLPDAQVLVIKRNGTARPLLGLSPSGPPALADLNGDGIQDILIMEGARVVAVQGNGQALAGWPQTVASYVPDGVVMTGDLDGDGHPEVVVAGAVPGSSYTDLTDQVIQAFRADGTPMPGFPVRIPMTKVWDGYPISAVVADVDGDGRSEIIIGLQGPSGVTILQGNGQTRPGWPQRLEPTSIFLDEGMEGAVADVDGDGIKEIIWSYRTVSGSFMTRNMIKVFHADGRVLPGWPVAVQAMNDTEEIRFDYLYLQSPPIAADLDGDGLPEIIERMGSTLVAYDVHGHLLPGFPHPLYGQRSYPFRDEAFISAVDLNGDERAELLAATHQGLFVFSYDPPAGALRLIWQKRYNRQPVLYTNDPVVADLDHNGRFEILYGFFVAGGPANPLYLFDFPELAGAPTTVERSWAHHRQGAGGQKAVSTSLPPSLTIVDPDVNDNGTVNSGDLGLVASRFGSHDPALDVNADGTVNSSDLGLVAQHFGLHWPPDNLAEGRRLTLFIRGSDPGGRPLSYSATQLPAGSCFNGVKSTPEAPACSARQFIWTPTYAQATGPYWPRFTASDGALTATQEVQITVKDVPLIILQPYAITPPSFSPNGDGIADTTLFSAAWNHTATWTLSIFDRPLSRLVRRLTGTGTSMSQSWDGRDDTGQALPNGIYDAIFSIWDGGNAIALSRDVTITGVPLRILTFSASANPFSPNGDGIMDTTTFQASFDRAAQTYTLEIRNSSGTLARRFTGSVPGTGLNLSVFWDGRIDYGGGVMGRAWPGTYTCTLRAMDAGGSAGTRAIQVLVQ